MDGRIVGVTENLARTMFKLNPAYEVEKCNVNAKVVEIGLTNGLIPINLKFPRSIIDDIINQEISVSDVMDKCTKGSSHDFVPSEGEKAGDANKDTDEDAPEKEEKPKQKSKRIKKHVKK